MSAAKANAVVYEKEKASWTERQKGILIEILLQIQLEGNFTDGGYKKDEWTKIVKQFGDRSGARYSQQQISSYISSIKAEWAFYQEITKISGFGLNEAGTKIDADIERWVELGPKYLKYKDGLSFFEDLNTLFIGRIATGSYAVSASSYRDSDARNKFGRRANDYETNSNDYDSDARDKSGRRGYDSHSNDYDSDEKDNPSSKKVCRTRKTKQDPNAALVNSLGKMIEGIASQGNVSQRQRNESTLDLSSPVKEMPQSKLSEALLMLTDSYSHTLSNKESMLLKMYWYANTIHPEMFLSFTDGERKSYVETKVAELTAYKA